MVKFSSYSHYGLGGPVKIYRTKSEAWACTSFSYLNMENTSASREKKGRVQYSSSGIYIDGHFIGSGREYKGFAGGGVYGGASLSRIRSLTLLSGKWKILQCNKQSTNKAGWGLCCFWELRASKNGGPAARAGGKEGRGRPRPHGPGVFSLFLLFFSFIFVGYNVI